MPTVNLYYKNENSVRVLASLVPKLKKYLADKLTCGDIKLTSSEISIRFVFAKGDGMIGDIELEITAHAFPERVKKQDEICREIRKFVMKEIPSVGDVKVWLKLCELGHSW